MSDEQRNYMNPDEIDVVVYHKNCNDGKAAAACAYKYLGDKVEYIPMNYGFEINFKNFEEKNIILLDFSWKKQEYELVKKVAKKVMILDHHDSAMKELENVEGCFFNMNESGASLAWEYFFPGNELPTFILYVKDRDLWTYKYRDESEPMFYGLATSFDRTVESWVKYLDNNDLVENLVNRGKVEMLKNHMYIENITKNALNLKMELDDENYNIIYLELDSPKLVSEISEKLYMNNDVDFTLCWYRDKQNTVPKYLEYYSDNILVNMMYGPQKYYVSLRSNKENIDLGEISKKIANGGGHKKAAGFNIDVHPNKKLKLYEL